MFTQVHVHRQLTNLSIKVATVILLNLRYLIFYIFILTSTNICDKIASLFPEKIMVKIKIKHISH